MAKINQARIQDISKLPHLMIHDSYVGIYDVGMFGSFVTDEKGNPQFVRGRRAQVQAKMIKSVHDLDTMMSKLFIAAAKRTRQYRVLKEKDLGYCDRDFWVRRNCNRSTVWGDHYYTINASQYDGIQNVGTFCFDGKGRYGAIIFDPGRIGVIKFQ